MKARKYIKRDRKTAGRATGTLLCRLSLPGISEKYEWRTQSKIQERTVGKIRKFIERHLPKDLNLQAGANFVIEAEVRASSGGLRRRALGMWKNGDDLELVFQRTAQVWASLEVEEKDWTATEVEVQPSFEGSTM